MEEPTAYVPPRMAGLEVGGSEGDASGGSSGGNGSGVQLQFEDLFLTSPKSSPKKESSLSPPSQQRPETSPHSAPLPEHPGRRRLDAFHLIQVIGKGAFGTVYKVRHRASGGVYAMKVIRKDRLLSDNNRKQAIVERNVLALLATAEVEQLPFIVRLYCAFQTTQRVYLVMDFINGGELMFHLKREQMLTEDVVRFYAVQIVLALEFLHQNKIIHRDLKPENVLVDASGYVVLTDFGLAKEKLDGKTHSWCGTEDYLAPEVLSRKGYDEAADWWSLGALLYDMLVGEPPFMMKKGESRKAREARVMSGKYKTPTFLTSEAAGLLRGLLNRDPSKRLRSSRDIFSQRFFQSYPTKKLRSRQLPAPYVPTFRSAPLSPENTTFFEKTLAEVPISPNVPSPPEMVLEANQGGELFEGFSFIAPTIRDIFTNFQSARSASARRVEDANESSPPPPELKEFAQEAAEAVEIHCESAEMTKLSL